MLFVVIEIEARIRINIIIFGIMVVVVVVDLSFVVEVEELGVKSGLNRFKIFVSEGLSQLRQEEFELFFAALPQREDGEFARHRLQRELGAQQTQGVLRVHRDRDRRQGLILLLLILIAVSQQQQLILQQRSG